MTEETQTRVKGPSALLVYKGIYPGDKRRRLYVYMVLDEDGAAPDDVARLPRAAAEGLEHVTYATPLVKGCSPGAVIRVAQLTEEGARPPFEYVCRWPHEDQVTAWQAAHRARTGAIDTEAKKAREMRAMPMWDRLEPFRAAYARCRGQRQRSQLLAAVIDYIVYW